MDNIGRKREIYKITIIGSIVNLVLVVFKFTAGILGHSAAMIADAIHSLSDFVTDVIVIFFVGISNKPQDKNHDYGHGKYETLATAIIGIVLLLVGFGVLWNGSSKIFQIINGTIIESPGVIALWAAIISIVFKEILYQYTVIKGKKINSKVVIANAWHHRSDAFSSIGTALGVGGAILFGKQWVILDPISAVVVSIFIIKVAISLLKPCLDELLEKSLSDAIEKEIEGIVTSFDGVSEPHNLRTRRLGSSIAIEIHIRMNGEMSLAESHCIACDIEDKLRKQYGESTHIGIHIEPIPMSVRD